MRKLCRWNLSLTKSCRRFPRASLVFFVFCSSEFVEGLYSKKARRGRISDVPKKAEQKKEVKQVDDESDAGSYVPDDEEYVVISITFSINLYPMFLLELQLLHFPRRQKSVRPVPDKHHLPRAFLFLFPSDILIKSNSL